MNVRDAQKLRNTLLIAGFFITLSGYLYPPLGIVGVVVSLSCLIPHFLYNKCPHCGHQLGRNEDQFCQHCGERID